MNFTGQVANSMTYHHAKFGGITVVRTRVIADAWKVKFLQHLKYTLLKERPLHVLAIILDSIVRI